jgi:DNA-binding CsgD family transcriptional regulator
VPADALLDLIGSVHGLLELGEFRTGLLAALQEAAPSDWISINDLGPDPATAVVLIEPPFPPAAHETFARLAHENPLIRRYQQTLDGRAYRFSDVTTRRELHELALYREFYGPIGLEHQIAFTLPHEPPRMLGIALSRKRRDFDDWERDVLERARPFLIQGYRNAVHYERARMVSGNGNGNGKGNGHGRAPKDALRARGLTPREAEVVGLIAAGRSNRDAAAELGLSARTVQKHLEHAYRKLGVRTRSEAAAMTWELADGRVPVP